MRFADVLLIGVVGVLLCYGVLVALTFRRTRDPASILVLTFAAYWTLVGAIYFLHAKRTAGGTVYTYLEDRLFPVTVDGVYAFTLAAYAVFLLVCVGTFLALSRPFRSGGTAALSAWEILSHRFAHPRLLAVIVALTVPKLALVGALVAANSGSASLYEATRTVKGSMSGELLGYQYLNISTAYAAATAFALWIGFRSGRNTYRQAHRATIWIGYCLLLAEVVGENALLGNRAVPLVVMAGVASGWARWRFLPSTGRTRRGLTIMLVGLGVVGLLALGAIGNARGGSLTSPAAIGASLVANLEDPSNILVQVGNSAEKVASHMSLVGVLRDGSQLREPFASNSYAIYTTLVNAPPDQVFTIHPVAAWWLRVGPAGVLLAGLLIGVVLAFCHRLAFRPGGAVLSAFALPAAILPAAGLPIVMLRSGPEAVRSVFIELLIIPALLCLPATLFGRTAHPVPTLLHRPIPTTPSGVRTMTTPLTNDAARAFAAIRRHWWIVVVAALLGGAIGLAGASTDATSTYEANVATPSVVAASVTWDPPTTQLAASLNTSATRSELGSAVEGTTLVTTVAPAPSAAVDIRVTAPTAERARAATAAYAQALADHYDAVLRQHLQHQLDAIERGIAAIGPRSGDRAITELATLKVDQAYVQQILSQKTQAPEPVALTSGGGSRATVILLVIAFGGLAAALVGFLGLGSRTLRFTDDVTDVTGEGSLVGAVPRGGSWAVGGLVDRLSTDSGRPVTFVPAGQEGIDDLRDSLLVGVGDPTRVRIAPPAAGDIGETAEGPVLLVARLGTDTRRQLDASYRAFSAANPYFVGVLTSDGRS